MPKFVSLRVKTASKGDITYKILRSQYQDLAQKNVTIGILEPGRSYPSSNATVGEVALWQEFGTNPQGNRPGIPSRSFLRTPFDAGLAQILALKTRLLRQIAAQKLTVAQGLALLGADGVRRVQNAIKRRIPPPLRPYTLERRKQQQITGTTPLLATGFLFRSIHFAVRQNQERS